MVRGKSEKKVRLRLVYCCPLTPGAGVHKRIRFPSDMKISETKQRPSRTGPLERMKRQKYALDIDINPDEPLFPQASEKWK